MGRMLRTARAAHRHYSARDGSTAAAAVTYFAFLSVFPLLALSFAVVGFVSDLLPGTAGVLNAILQNLLPGMVGDDPHQISLATIEDAATAAAGVGVFAMLYAGLNWISATRDALASMFEVESSRPAAFGRRRMLAALAGQEHRECHGRTVGISVALPRRPRTASWQGGPPRRRG